VTPPGEDIPDLILESLSQPSEMTIPSTAGMLLFTGLNSTAHLLVCLRFNLTVTGETARLTADLSTWALVGRDLHPQDDFSEFHEMTVTSLLSDQQSLVAAANTSPIPLRRRKFLGRLLWSVSCPVLICQGVKQHNPRFS